MKLYQKIGIACVAILALVCGVLLFKTKQKTQNKGFADATIVDTINYNTFSSSSTLPVKILSRNYNRLYAMIQNDSNVPLYIYLGNFTSSSTASTTVLTGTGIRLNTAGSYEIKSDNMWIGDVWLASTTGANNVLVNER